MLEDGMMIPMANDEEVSVAISGGDVTLNGEAQVVSADNFVDNGVAHLINVVLKPSFLSVTIVDIASSATTTLAGLVVFAELDGVLSDTDANFTVSH